MPYCKGGVMARNPQWRGSVSDLARSASVSGSSARSPPDLLSVDIFFDMRGVHGDTSLADTLWREAFDAAKGQAAFAKLLAGVRRHDRDGPHVLRAASAPSRAASI